MPDGRVYLASGFLFERIVPANTPTRLSQLQALADEPHRQAALAISLLDPKQRADVILAALRILTENPTEDARQALVVLYSFLAENGLKRDPGAFLRTTTLNALAPIAEPQDVQYFLDATETYEFLPPGFTEEAGALRAAGLLGLYELNHPATAYYAARLMVDQHISEMSAEPAATAVSVLAALDELLPLYQFVLQNANLPLPELRSACLRNLVRLPAELLPALVKCVKERDSALEMLGLFDLLLEHESGPQEIDFVAAYLVNPDDIDVYRYLLHAALLTRDPRLTRLILKIAADETNVQRRAILREALSPYDSLPEIGGLLDKLGRG